MQATPGDVTDEAWRRDAACRGMDPSVFFPDDWPAGVAAAKAVCAGCPVTSECLDAAVSRREAFGVWGGTTPQDRGMKGRLLAPLPAAGRCLRCGSPLPPQPLTGRHRSFCADECRRRHYYESTGR